MSNHFHSFKKKNPDSKNHTINNNQLQIDYKTYRTKPNNSNNIITGLKYFDTSKSQISKQSLKFLFYNLYFL